MPNSIPHSSGGYGGYVDMSNDSDDEQTPTEIMYGRVLDFSIDQLGAAYVLGGVDTDAPPAENPIAQNRVVQMLNDPDTATFIISSALKRNPNATPEAVALFYDKFIKA